MTIGVLRHVAATMLLAPLCMGDTIYVDDDRPAGGDGQSWSGAFKYLQDAIPFAGPDDEIHVAQGTYKPDQSYFGVVTPGDPAATFDLAGIAALRGGYRGCPDGNCDGGDPNERDIDLYETTLSGDLLGDDGEGQNHADNSHNVVTLISVAREIVFDGFTVTAGRADHGAALLSQQSNPVVTQCAFVRNYGNALAFEGGEPSLSNCMIAANQSLYGNGAGISGSHTELALMQCLISGNAAFGGAGLSFSHSQLLLAGCTITGNATRIGAGAGLASNDSDVILTDCLIRWNTATADGGGASCSGGTLTCVRCTIADNWAWDGIGWGDGGGICGASTSVMLTQCALSGNVAGRGGGAYKGGYNTTTTITDCVIAGNAAGYWGGAIALVGAQSEPATLTCLRTVFVGNATTATTSRGLGGALYGEGRNVLVSLAQAVFSGNSARYGAALDFDPLADSDLAMTDCAFVGNVTTATASTGAVHVYSPMPGSVTNCTFAGNLAAAGGAAVVWAGGAAAMHNCILSGDTPAEVLDAGNVAITFSDVQGGRPGEGNIDADPLFVGGPTGTWTAPGMYDDITRQVTLADSTAAWEENAFAGAFVKPDATSALQFLIVGNTATTMTVWADRRTVAAGTSWIPANATYQVRNLRLAPTSPSINAGSNYGGVLSPFDLDGAARVQQCRVDMGAYESPHGPSILVDCNGNGASDDCDIFDGTSADANQNHVPDECEATAALPGDLNCDGAVSFADINAFVLYLSNFDAWLAMYADCSPQNGDIDQDGVYPSFSDISPFVTLLSSRR